MGTIVERTHTHTHETIGLSTKRDFFTFIFVGLYGLMFRVDNKTR